MVHNHKASLILATRISSNQEHKVRAIRLKDSIHPRASILRRATLLLQGNTRLPVNTLLDTTHRNHVMTLLTPKLNKTNVRPTDVLCKTNGSLPLGTLVNNLANYGSSPLFSNEVHILNNDAILVPAPRSRNNLHKDNKLKTLGSILA
jgi:hypothetical protein